MQVRQGLGLGDAHVHLVPLPGVVWAGRSGRRDRPGPDRVLWSRGGGQTGPDQVQLSEVLVHGVHRDLQGGVTTRWGLKSETLNTGLHKTTRGGATQGKEELHKGRRS